MGFTTKRYDIQECALRAFYLVNLKFEDRQLNDTSADIHRYVYQLMDVFCDRLKSCSTAAPTAGLAKTKADIENKSAHSCWSC